MFLEGKLLIAGSSLKSLCIPDGVIRSGWGTRTGVGAGAGVRTGRGAGFASSCGFGATGLGAGWGFGEIGAGWNLGAMAVCFS